MHVVGPELLDHATERMHRTLDKIAVANDNEEFGTGWGSFSILELPKWL